MKSDFCEYIKSSHCYISGCGHRAEGFNEKWITCPFCGKRIVMYRDKIPYVTTSLYRENKPEILNVRCSVCSHWDKSLRVCNSRCESKSYWIPCKNYKKE